VRTSVSQRVVLSLCATAALSTLLAMLLQAHTLTADLEEAASDRLDRAAGAAVTLLDQHQHSVRDRHRAIARTPEFRANLETAHVPTLMRLARALREQAPTTGAVLFTNRRGGHVAGAGDRLLLSELQRRARSEPGPPCGARGGEDDCRDVAGEGQPFLIAHEGGLFIGTSIALFTERQFVGRFLATEALPAELIQEWSGLAGARLELRDATDPRGKLERVAVALGGTELRIVGSFEVERKALAHLHTSALAAGAAALACAFAFAVPLSRGLVRPIRTIERAANRIRGGDWSTRLRTDRADELGDVARAFDTMLDHIETTQAGLQHAQRIAKLGGWSLAAGASEFAVSVELRRMLGLDPSTELAPVEALLQRVHPDDREHLSSALRCCEETGLAFSIDHRLALEDGSKRAVHTQGERATDADGNHRLEGTIQDITERKDVEEEVRRLAYEDGLTGLGNRRDRIVGVVEELGPVDAPASVHRLGGDEFAVLLPRLTDGDAPLGYAKRILDSLASSIELNGYDINVSASIGIARWPDEGDHAEALLQGCDTAMYHAKRQGRGLYRVYDASMRESVERRLHVESRLRGALERGDLQVFYQPKVDLASGRVAGLEALLRWQDPELGAVRPDEFIALAEGTGQILALGQWVLREAARQAARWRDEDVTGVPIAVNVSSSQIDAGVLVETVLEILEETGLPASQLELEVTESALLHDEVQAIDQLREIKRLGLGLSLDDFGTGYSSLSYLRRLPIDAVKIDRSFVEGIAENTADHDLLGSIVAMAKVLGLNVVAEGAETESQRDLLAEMGCDMIQGYWYSAPVPAEEVPLAIEQCEAAAKRDRAKANRSG